jgi:hypothetical protein
VLLSAKRGTLDGPCHQVRDCVELSRITEMLNGKIKRHLAASDNARPFNAFSGTESIPPTLFVLVWDFASRSPKSCLRQTSTDMVPRL